METAPSFTLQDQRDEPVSLADFAGCHVLVYFYPKASTPGCTTQACGLRDVADRIGDTVILGISPDAPAALARFDAKHSLGFTLLSDPDHVVAEAYGVWVRKQMHGTEYFGIQRSAFLVAPDGTLARSWPTITPAETPDALLAALAELTT